MCVYVCIISIVFLDLVTTSHLNLFMCAVFDTLCCVRASFASVCVFESVLLCNILPCMCQMVQISKLIDTFCCTLCWLLLFHYYFFYFILLQLNLKVKMLKNPQFSYWFKKKSKKSEKTTCSSTRKCNKTKNYLKFLFLYIFYIYFFFLNTRSIKFKRCDVH